ncbi:MAG: hypothetical protein V3S31_00870 [Dehalococcoidia bacterium]
MTAFAVAVERGQYELAALRLMLAIVHAIDRLDGAAASSGAVAGAVREELLALMTAEAHQ